MTPHARKFSLFQASLRASSASASSAAAATASQAHDTWASSTSTDSANNNLHENEHHQHQHDHHEFHDHAHPRTHRHSHYLPSSRGKKGQNRNGDSGAQVVEAVEAADAAAPQKADMPNNNELRRRQAKASGTVTEIVQTISVVQVIDGNGSIVTLQTLYTPTGSTVDPSDITRTPTAGTPAAELTATVTGSPGPAAKSPGGGAAGAGAGGEAPSSSSSSSSTTLSSTSSSKKAAATTSPTPAAPATPAAPTTPAAEPATEQPATEPVTEPAAESTQPVTEVAQPTDAPSPASALPSSNTAAAQPGTTVVVPSDGTQGTGVPTEPGTVGTSSTSPATVPTGSGSDSGAGTVPVQQQSSTTAQTAPANTGVGEPFTNGTATTPIAIPLTTGPSTTPLPPAFNSTTAHIYSNNTLQHTLFANTSRTSTTSSHLYSSSTFSSSLIASRSSSSASGEATAADGAGGAGGGPAGTAPAAGPTSTSNDNDSSGPPTSVLVGSVIGGLAGIAVLLVVAMFLLKWKKKRDARGHQLLGDGDDMISALAGSATRGMTMGGGTAGGAGGASGPGGGGDGPSGGSGPVTGPSSGPSSGPAGGMSENRTTFLMPFAAALASGQKRLSRGTTGGHTFSSEGSSSAAGSGTTERGFYRVSGKKLPSVLQHGGDGYEDPRESMMSVNPSLYRDSQGFFGGAGGPATTPVSRYAVGSPMRPESGVPIFQPGPGKAVAMRVPLSRHGSSIHDDIASVRNLTPPPGIDPIGRSLASQDNSRASGSRFTEDIF